MKLFAIIITIMFVSIPVLAADTGIAQRGKSDGGCIGNSSSNAKEGVAGDWLGMSSKSIQPTVLYVAKGVIGSERPDEKYFFKGLALTSGEIDFAKIKRISNTRQFRQEWAISWRDRKFRFAKLGFDFELVEYAATGKELWREGRLLSGKELSKMIEKDPDLFGYDGEWTSIESAGDFNGDGRLDLLLSYREKEAHGLALWLSDKKSKRLVEAANSPTEFTDCLPNTALNTDAEHKTAQRRLAPR